MEIRFYCNSSSLFIFSFEKQKFYCRYAFEGVMQAIYLDRPNLTCLEIYCYLRSPSKILTMMDMPTVPFHVILIILAFWIFFFHLITYAVLLWKIYYAKKWRSVKLILINRLLKLVFNSNENLFLRYVLNKKLQKIIILINY